jgi:hypothetical protein
MLIIHDVNTCVQQDVNTVVDSLIIHEHITVDYGVSAWSEL